MPTDIQLDGVSTMVTVVRDSCRQYAGKTSYISMGKSISYAELDALTRDFAAWLHANGLGKGDRIALMMPNLLQYPVCLFGAWRAGCVVVNCNPLYTAHELEHQLADSGARAPSWWRTTSRPRCSRPCPKRHRARAGHLHRRIAGPAQGRLVDLVVKRVKRMVPAWSIPGAQRLGQARARPRPALHRGRAEPGRPGLPAIRAAPPAWPRRPCCPRQPDGQRQPGARLGEAAGPGRRRTHRDGAAAVSHLRADGELPDVHEDRRQQPAHRQPTRHTGADQGNVQGAGQRLHRGQHAVQRAAEQPRFRQAGFLAPAPDAGRRHGGAALGGRPLARRHRPLAGPGLWPDRDLARRDHQPAGREGIHRLHRPAGAVHRHLHPRRRGPRTAHRRARRDLRARPR